jgi:glycosyltransferase involved in cell wall biosynthesis
LAGADKQSCSKEKILVLKVCMILQDYYPKDIRVHKEVMALASRGHQVSVIALRGHNEAGEEVLDGVKIYRAALSKKRAGILRYLYEYAAFFLYSTYKLNMLDLKEKFDVLHINTLPDFLVFSAFIQKLKGRKVILDMHEIMPEFYMSKFAVGPRHPVVRLMVFLERISLKYADEVITINEPIKRIFKRRAIPDKRITVVMNTVDGSTAQARAKQAHETLNCVYHGTLTDLYGVDTAIKGFAAAYRKRNDMLFHIFGNGPQLPLLKSLVKELNIQQAVLFHGEVAHDRMVDCLSEMDLGILASRKDIFLDLSFSNKLGEYIYLRIPVISSNLDTTKYYFTDNQLLYFDSGNIEDLSRQILFAYTNREHIQEMAASAYERYRSIDWGIMAERYLGVVEGIRND